MIKRTHIWLLLALLLGLVLTISGCFPFPPPPEGPSLRDFDSNGERIYFTATSDSGDPIYPKGFTMMHRFSCVDCHGPQGKGGTVSIMMSRFKAPDITWPELTGEHGEQGEHEEHPPYTEETVKEAITQGVDPAGHPLEEYMPRWQISPADLDDLIAYLKTLE